MIKNIIFDMGKVLIEFAPEEFMARYGVTGDELELLRSTIFMSEEWRHMDDGSMDEPDVVAVMKTRLPEKYHTLLEDLIMRWDDPILPMKGMADLIQELKGKGYGIFLLSNASHRQHDYWPRIPGSEYFDGTVISADIRCMKPNPGIYEHLFKTFNLVPGECFFIDDLPANIEGARKAGMEGFVFKGDVNELREELKKVLV